MSKIQLPKGFNPIQAGGQFAPSVDWKRTKTVTGKLVALRSAKFKGQDGKPRTVRIAEIEISKGNNVSIFESAGNRALFDVKKGTRVFVAYKGLKKLPGRKQPMREFVVATANA